MAIVGDERDKVAKGRVVPCVLARSAAHLDSGVTPGPEHLCPVFPAQGRTCKTQSGTQLKACPPALFPIAPLGPREVLALWGTDAGEMWPLLVKCKGINHKKIKTGKRNCRCVPGGRVWERLPRW